MARRHRSEAKPFPLWQEDQERSRGWRVAKNVSYEEGEALVEKGAAVRLCDDFGNVGAYQMLEQAAKPDIAVSVQSSTVITKAEMQAYAFTKFRDGRSLTAQWPVNDERRFTRKGPNGRLRPAEDFVERAIAKVNAYAEGLGDMKASRAIPRPQLA